MAKKSNGKVTITYADLERALCTKDAACTAHREAARKIWTKLGGTGEQSD